MVTYKATNIKTGRYYIGSALNYCLYIGRMGHHHYTKVRQQFQIDLQENPRDFVWEILREDDLGTRDYEQELLYACVGDPLCYNLAKKCGKTNVPEPKKVFVDGDRWDAKTREKMSQSAKSKKGPARSQKRSAVPSGLGDKRQKATMPPMRHAHECWQPHKTHQRHSL